MRAAWTASEILSAFQEDIASLELQPGGGGDFEFTIDGDLAYSKRATGEYPELKTLKQAVAAAIDRRAAAGTPGD